MLHSKSSPIFLLDAAIINQCIADKSRRTIVYSWLQVSSQSYFVWPLIQLILYWGRGEFLPTFPYISAVRGLKIGRKQIIINIPKMLIISKNKLSIKWEHSMKKWILVRLLNCNLMRILKNLYLCHEFSSSSVIFTPNDLIPFAYER